MSRFNLCFFSPWEQNAECRVKKENGGLPNLCWQSLSPLNTLAVSCRCQPCPNLKFGSLASQSGHCDHAFRLLCSHKHWQAERVETETEDGKQTGTCLAKSPLSCAQCQTYCIQKHSEHVHAHAQLYSLLLPSLKAKVLTYGQTPGLETVERRRKRQTAGGECWPCSNTWWSRDARQRKAERRRTETKGSVGGETNWKPGGAEGGDEQKGGQRKGV